MSHLVVGIDEVGLGPWAGPLVVCAFAAPSESWVIEGLNDSKKLSDRQRVDLSKTLLRTMPTAFELVWVPVEEIDSRGIGRVHMEAMERAAEKLIERVGVPWRVIVDGDRQPFAGAECYPKADGTYPSVMAASIVAKVARDEYMVRQSISYPEYGFDRHVGYGTAYHRAAIQRFGLCPLHRRSYKPIKKFAALQVPCLGPA